MNSAKTFLLMGLLMVLALLVGDAVGGKQGMIVAFGIAAAMNFGSYWFSDKIVLKMHGAQEITESEAPELYQIVKKLADSGGLPMPRVYIMSADQPNAFATGRDPNHAAVAVTNGILQIMDQDELEGVLAHELTHVKNRDILVGTIAATMAGAIMMLGRSAMFLGSGHDDEGRNPIGGIIAMVVAPVAAMLIQMAISRGREYGADAGGAQISGKPWALANALRKLERGVQTMPMNTSPATAHMFIMNPFSAGGLASLFSTHPPTADRIARLEQM